MTHKKNRLKFHHEMPSGRELIEVQVCSQCNAMFPMPTYRRKQCPKCGGTLITKTRVLTQKTLKALKTKK